MDPRWKHPFTCIVAGPTGCGKTTFVARLLRNASTMIDPSPERVTWYYGEWQSAYENLDIPNLHLEEGLPTSFDASNCNIVVLDDLMAETDERVTNLYTKENHHCNTSVIYIVQNLFPKKQGESHHQFELTVHSGVQESARCVTNDYIGQSDVPGRVKFIQEAFADAKSTPYGYILVDRKQDTLRIYACPRPYYRTMLFSMYTCQKNKQSCWLRHSSFHDDSPRDVSLLV